MDEEEYEYFSLDDSDDMDDDDDDLLFAELEAYFVSAEMYVRCLELVIPQQFFTVLERRRRRVQPDSSADSETVNASNQGDTLAAKLPLKRRARNAIRMAAANRLSRQVANRVIKFARAIKNIYENEMSCLNCGSLPICPVTGECGHTRCYKCAVGTKCTCGTFFSRDTSVNVLIQDLTKKYTSALSEFRNVPRLTKLAADAIPSKENVSSSELLPRASCSSARLNRWDQAGPSRARKQGVPIAPLARYNHAVDLLRMGHHRDAIPHLALAAAAQPSDRQTRMLLAQAITTLSKNSDPRTMTTQLNRAVRRLSTTMWVRAQDLECILCCDNFTEPVTTPCGHTFCRTCIERMLDYAKRCPLCLRNLQAFKLSETKNTRFVEAALHLANVVSVRPPLEPDIIPIFVCTVAYPSLPCPLFLFEPRYWLMIRRVLESGSRRFGMIAFESSQDYANYGTILEVRDCVCLEDGRSIISTIGISRFQVLEFANRDGCDVARIVPITDKEPTDLDEIKEMATNIMCKTLPWLDLLNDEVYADIKATFGALETIGFYDDPWWEGPDGPTWLWWIVAVLPLRKEIKVLILSTDSLVKRMMAVERTLDAMERTIDSLINPLRRSRYTL